MLFLLCANNVQAFVFHVEFSVTRDMTVDFCCICPNFSTCIHMLILLYGNNVQACAFHVECKATRDLTVDFLLFMLKPYHVPKSCKSLICYSCYVIIMCKYAYFVWDFVTHGISLWNFEKKGEKYVL